MNYENAVYPKSDQLMPLASQDNGPIVMLNLLKFRDRAKYKEGGDKGLTGREAYNLYGDEMQKIVQRNGGRILFAGDAKSVVVGQVEGAWDVVALVEYPSAKEFVRIATSPEVAAIGVHREAGLAGQLLIQTIAR